MPVKLLHVLEKGDSDTRDLGRTEQAVRALLPDPAAEVEIILAKGPAPKTIARVAAEQSAALVAVGAARFNDLGDYVLGTAVDNLIRQSPSPVLVVKRRPRAPYRDVLCAVDLSDCAAHALRCALKLLPECRVIALHAYHVGFEGWQRDAYVKEETKADAARNLDEFLAGLDLAPGDRDRVEARIGYGNPEEVIGDEIERNEPDLLVLGTHGRGGFRQATLGSTASAILEWARPDTLVVPPGR